MHLVNVAQRAGLHEFVRLLELRHAALLRADLHHLLMLALRLDDRGAFGEVVRERFFDIHVLPGGAGGDRHRNMPVIGRADQHGVDVGTFQQRFEFFRLKRLRIGQLATFRQMVIPDIADGGDPDTGNLSQRLHQPTLSVSFAA